MADNKNIPGGRPPAGPGNNKPGNNKPKFNSYWIIGLILLVLIGMQFIGSSGSLTEIDPNRFYQILKDGDV